MQAIIKFKILFLPITCLKAERLIYIKYNGIMLPVALYGCETWSVTY